MDELQSSSSQGNLQDCESSFQILRLSGKQNQESINQNTSGNDNRSLSTKQQNLKKTEEILQPQLSPQRSLTQSVRQTYKMCCSNLRTIKTNIAYNIRHSSLDIFTNRQKLVFNFNLPLTLLGKVYSIAGQDKEKFLEDFCNVIWLTYRSGIYGVETDAGWGCMIRVCQMVLAETFKRIMPALQLNEIIQYFKDSPQAYFSLTRICQKGNIKQRWTSSIQIMDLLKKLIQKLPSVNLTIDLHSSFLQMQNLKQLDYQSYPLLLFISNRLGKTKFEASYYDHFLEVMSVNGFIGVVGGNGGQALYLIGNYGKKLLFMDPHYVQESFNSQDISSTSTYFQTQPYVIDLEALAPSVGFNFLIKSKSQYKNLLMQLYRLQTKFHPWCCFEIYSEEIKKIVKAEKHKDDSFEIIE